MLDSKGVEYRVVDYLRDGLSEEDVERLAKLLGVDPGELIRTRAPAYRELGLEKKKPSGKAAARLIAKHPELLERPIVVRGRKAVIARPPERALELAG